MAATEAHQYKSQDSRPSCPFCPYVAQSHEESDMYMLLQHLELSHPENGESPFIAREASPVEQRKRSRSSTGSRSATGRGSRSSSLTPCNEQHDEDNFYVECPLKCGEAVHIRELDDHMELHDIEGQGLDEVEEASPIPETPPLQWRKRKPSSTESPSQNVGAEHHLSSRRSGELLSLPDVSTSRGHRTSSPLHNLKELFLGPAPRKTRPIESKSKSANVRRLGKAELGPHAFEEQMPSWLYKQLEQGEKINLKNVIGPGGQILQMEVVANQTPGVIPVLAQLCAQDQAVSKVFLCHPSVKHIFKTPREGGFCGYRNIQMLVSFMQGTKFPGWENFLGPIPSIPRLQEMIETAWDRGFNSSCRIETGGIRGTRKYIGTPEAQALFCSIDVRCEANAFRKPKDPTSTKPRVHDNVIDAVVDYFSSAGVADPSLKVHQTGLAPIYFQHPGHSLCIVGVEIRKSGNRNLLVFDPMFQTAPGITRLLGARFHAPRPDKLLKAFRRGNYYLGKYNSFEILKLMAPSTQNRIQHMSPSEQPH